ncbi:DUF4254 domain-containing protein [Mycobacterium seoulense]|uniref:DUF4254 domain-containing protein n=1 Tax=Mycobacterium seoulense TaxID=386911 RepID=A0A7I7P3W7_9MYCO|nr:DUF4254 domain-containing protein [Mycobacterium seoulense]MCV7438341.1 DUF4254 domain-containing protein [Mycobacterium seoulense]BBY03389.1 hypothetical protein MSEO_38880 [Mycobacterium seoulense]
MSMPESLRGPSRDPAASDLLAAARQFSDLAQAWHCQEPEMSWESRTIAAMALHLHAINFALWHHEDAVRRPGAGDHEIAGRKRLIDDLNDQRNKAIEGIDVALLDRFQPNPLARLHTETPGTIIDRLSVLTLRILHTADPPNPCLAVLDEQYDDLFGGLEQLLTGVEVGDVRFKLYRQFKAAGQRSYCALFETRDA